MDFAPVYLVWRFFYRFVDFFHHWYFDGSRMIGHRFIEALSIADESLAIRVTFRHFTQPLFRDYTVIGRILGVIFRSCRIALGLIVYAFMAALFGAFYLAWIGLPVAIIVYASKGF